jgi:hypothetical protein
LVACRARLIPRVGRSVNTAHPTAKKIFREMRLHHAHCRHMCGIYFAPSPSRARGCTTGPRCPNHHRGLLILSLRNVASSAPTRVLLRATTSRMAAKARLRASRPTAYQGHASRRMQRATTADEYWALFAQPAVCRTAPSARLPPLGLWDHSSAYKGPLACGSGAVPRTRSRRALTRRFVAL